jgi:ABC-2 type transport system ATP-binding protein/lipopolysaccharide transport system ATP-binding protein
MAFLRLRDIWVEFPIYQGSARSLKKALLAQATKGNLMQHGVHRVSVVALRKLNLNVKEGDRLAVIGANGAGKSTLLKVLAGIYQPTRGQRNSLGKVTALLTSSAGLSPEATGRENIILRGMFMGIHPREMEAKITEIADFTELGLYLDLPIRTYSAGMVVRLSFAASTAIAPEILLMDEWLSAGDASFFNKAQKRLEHFIGRSSILVLASHSISLLQEWCNRAILLHHGELMASGSVKEVAEVYQAMILRDQLNPTYLPEDRSTSRN